MHHIVLSAQLREAVSILQKGGVIVFPTETAYGLAADATNKKAVARVMKIKARAGEKSFPLIVASGAMARRLAIFSTRLLKLAQKHWPGALTIVVPVRTYSPPLQGGRACRQAGVRGGYGNLDPNVVRDGTIAIRVSSNKIARALCQRLNKPIVATSANVSGLPSCFTVAAIQKQFASQKDKPDMYLDVGTLPRRRPSTIVKEEGGELVVLRQGAVRLTYSNLRRSSQI